MSFTKRNLQAFTLLQVMIVIAIIGLLAALAIPKIHAAPGNAGEVYQNNTVRIALTNAILCDRTITNLTGGQLITNTVGSGKHLGIGYRLTGGDATNTGTFALRFKTGFARTNVTSGFTFTLTDTANGTTAVQGWQVIPEYTLGPVDQVILAAVTNGVSNVGTAAAGDATLNSVWLEWRN